ncbi:stress enhanced protein 1, chloroplastic-like [Chenopodium quinoa]|uniref:stress enhanced protein 1, chloroplastic-like n=1 Tax=Chenopodium quinoa TaxID=63459 RepID=UPI000B784F01|nr:stress enhanced protein 1, chloroplastic-like [Chenopodium quinoa]
MAVSQVSASFNLSVYDACTPNSPRLCTVSRIPTSNFARNATSFVRGSPLVIRTSAAQLKAVHKSNSVSIKCQQSANEGGLDVWLGRIAMIGFAVAITVEVSTGKGLLENFGLTSPLPTVALAVTGLVGVLTAVFIFQSASKN